MKNFDKVLQSIGVNTSISDVTATLQRIKTMASVPNTNLPPDFHDAIAVLESQVTLLNEEANDLADTLDRFQQVVDADLPNMKKVVGAGIVDYKSAVDATYRYDPTWFRNLIMSQEAKVDFAGFLLQTVSIYTHDNLETVKQIAEQNYDMLQIIKRPDNDD